MACRECDHTGLEAGWYDQEGCIDGTVYGYCTSELCDGMCDDYGSCPCECHDT